MKVRVSTRQLVFGSRFFAVLMIVLAFTSHCGCGNNSESAKQSYSNEQLYRLHCSGCHGDGSGNGHVAGTLPIRPRNLTHSDWQDSVSDQHIYRVIEGGGEAVKLNKAMPAFDEKLSPEEITGLVSYIRSLER